MAAEQGNPLSQDFEIVTSTVSGRRYRIARVWAIDLVRDGVLTIPAAEQAAEILEKQAAGEALDEFDQEKMRLFMAALLMRGLKGVAEGEGEMQRVRLIDRPFDQCPAGTLSIDDFSPEFDRELLVTALCQLSGFGTVEAAEAQESVVSREGRPEDSFRGDEGASVHPGAPAGE